MTQILLRKFVYLENGFPVPNSQYPVPNVQPKQRDFHQGKNLNGSSSCRLWGSLFLLQKLTPQLLKQTFCELSHCTMHLVYWVTETDILCHWKRQISGWKISGSDIRYKWPKWFKFVWWHLVRFPDPSYGGDPVYCDTSPSVLTFIRDG